MSVDSSHPTSLVYLDLGAAFDTITHIHHSACSLDYLLVLAYLALPCYCSLHI